jgi:hypothetical protein
VSITFLQFSRDGDLAPPSRNGSGRLPIVGISNITIPENQARFNRYPLESLIFFENGGMTRTPKWCRDAGTAAGGQVRQMQMVVYELNFDNLLLAGDTNSWLTGFVDIISPGGNVTSAVRKKSIKQGCLSLASARDVPVR